MRKIERYGNTAGVFSRTKARRHKEDEKTTRMLRKDFFQKAGQIRGQLSDELGNVVCPQHHVGSKCWSPSAWGSHSLGYNHEGAPSLLRSAECNVYPDSLSRSVFRFIPTKQQDSHLAGNASYRGFQTIWIKPDGFKLDRIKPDRNKPDCRFSSHTLSAQKRIGFLLPSANPDHSEFFFQSQWIGKGNPRIYHPSSSFGRFSSFGFCLPLSLWERGRVRAFAFKQSTAIQDTL